ncbi:unnamed protein product [Prunus armeniaca]
MKAGGSWTTMEDVLLCECWVQVGHDHGQCEMKFSHMWRKRSGFARTEMALASRWKFLNKELGKWREQKQGITFEASKILATRLCKHNVVRCHWPR